MSMRDRYWGGTYDDPFATATPLAFVRYVHGERVQVIEACERRYYIVEPVGQLKPQNKRHGPERKGRGGKIKRY